MRGHRSLVVCSKKPTATRKAAVAFPGSGVEPPPTSLPGRPGVQSPRIRTRGCLGWGSALFPRHDCRRWRGKSPSRLAARSSLLSQALPVPMGGWEPRLSQSPSTGNAVVRLKEYKLERETVHQQVLKRGQQYIRVLLRLRLYFPGGK